jgi:hypothetical protein
MRQKLAMRWWPGITLLMLATALGQPAKHPFTANDWATLRSAKAAAVSPDGLILYHVTFGGEKGPTRDEWWTIAADGSQPAKLEVSDDFSPLGFTADGGKLYGAWKVNKQRQLAIFPLHDHKASSVPATVVLLPRGIESVAVSPDGKRFAIVADPRAVDALEDVRHVVEPQQSSLYVVNADGTMGTWWCRGLASIGDAPVWSADGMSLVLLSLSPRIGHHDVSAGIDVCSATGARHVTDVANVASGLAWANGGKEIAFLSTRSEVLTPEHVWTVASTGGIAADRTSDLQGTVVELSGDPRGNVWVNVDHGVQTDLEEFHDGALRPVYHWREGVVDGLPAGSPYTQGTAQIALNVGDPNHTVNVAVPDGDHLRKITHEGDTQLTVVEMGTVQPVHWKSKEGIALEGIATFPAGYGEGNIRSWFCRMVARRQTIRYALTLCRG